MGVLKPNFLYCSFATLYWKQKGRLCCWYKIRRSMTRGRYWKKILGRVGMHKHEFPLDKLFVSPLSHFVHSAKVVAVIGHAWATSFSYGLSFVFYQRPRAMKRRRVIKTYAHACAFLRDKVCQCFSRAFLSRLGAMGSQLICSLGYFKYLITIFCG